TDFQERQTEMDMRFGISREFLHGLTVGSYSHRPFFVPGGVMACIHGLIVCFTISWHCYPYIHSINYSTYCSPMSYHDTRKSRHQPNQNRLLHMQAVFSLRENH